MSDNKDEKNKFSPKPVEAGQPKRPHATIDLKATEIASGGVNVRADGAVDKTATAGAAATIANAARVEIKKAETSGGIKTGAGSVPGTSASMGYGPTSKPATAAGVSNSAPVSEVAGRRGGLMAMLGAGLTGGVLALLGSTFGPSLLGLTDMMQTQQELNPAAQRRIAVIEQALRDRPAAGGDVTSKVGAIETRVAKIEESARTLADGQIASCGSRADARRAHRTKGNRRSDRGASAEARGAIAHCGCGRRRSAAGRARAAVGADHGKAFGS